MVKIIVIIDITTRIIITDFLLILFFIGIVSEFIDFSNPIYYLIPLFFLYLKCFAIFLNL